MVAPPPLQSQERSPLARIEERTTGEPGAVPKTGSLITFMSSLKSFAFPPSAGRADTCRKAGSAGRMDTGAIARRVRWPGAWRRASRRSTGSPPRACGRGIPRRARPPGAPRHHSPPAAARRCCCGCECSAGPRRGCAGRRAGRQPRTRRRKRTRRRRLPRRERRAGRRQRGWRSSAGRPARSSRRGAQAQARRWARAPGLQQDPARQCPAWFPRPLPQSQWSGWAQRHGGVGWPRVTESHLCLGNARCCL